MITDQFKTHYDKLNPQQKKAVDTIEGPVMVIAGPGTGKTQVLILRIAKILLETQIEPENILALTFTESAVYEIRKRLVSLIGTPGYRVEINTFHGFCNKIIQHNEHVFEDLVEAESIDDLEQITLIESIVESEEFKYIKPFGAPFHYARSILQAIGELKKEGVSVEAFAKGIQDQEKDFEKIADLYNEKGVYKGVMKGKYQVFQKKIQRNKELLIMYKKYEDALVKERKYDYQDMLLRVIQVFNRDKILLLQMQELYQYFLVDEHQDTNRAQNQIIQYLCDFYPNPNLFVVGDEKQAIFRFQGASLENFLYFKHLYKEAVLINLNQNYRSSQMILDAAKSLIAHNSKTDLLSERILLSQGNQKEAHIKVAKLNTYWSEYYYIAKDIQTMIKKGVDPREIAVLSRNNKDIDPLSSIFEQLHISYVIASEQNLFQDLAIAKLISIFYSILRLGSDSELIETMHIDIFEIDPLDIYKLMQFARETNTFLWEVLSLQTYKGKVVLQTQKKIESFIKRIREWKEKSMNDSFDNVFISVLNESGFLKRMLSRERSVDVIEKVSILYNEVKRLVSKNHLFNLDDFISYIDSLKSHHLYPSSNKSVHKQGVRLMTAHKAKGLEFDYIYIINAYDGHWGNKRKEGSLFLIPWEHLSVIYDKTPEDEINEDERRLFYVALTRGRKQVTISYSSLSEDEKEQVGSQFIEEIDPLFKKQTDTSSFEKYILLHPEIFLQITKDPSISHVQMELLEHKQFFCDLFAHRGLSVSGLNNYLECPWKYFFRNLLLLPDVKNQNMIFGSAIHAAINAYLIRRKDRKVEVPWVLEEYQKYLFKQPLSEKELRNLNEKGKVVLKDFIKAKANHWKKETESELTIKGIRFNDGIFLNGKIDMIEHTNKEGEVIVYDFKTGKPKSRSYIEGTIKSSKGDYKRQLVFYKILLDLYKEGRLRIKMKEGVIEFVEKNEKGLYQSERFTITEAESDELKKLILKISHEIQTLSFINKTCDDSNCHYCRLRSFMDGR